MELKWHYCGSAEVNEGVWVKLSNYKLCYWKEKFKGSNNKVADQYESKKHINRRPEFWMSDHLEYDGTIDKEAAKGQRHQDYLVDPCLSYGWIEHQGWLTI